MTADVGGSVPPRVPAAGAAPRAAAGRARAYLRLAKLDIVDYYLALPVAWTLLPAASRLGPRTLVTLGLFLLGEVLVIVAAVAFDDVTGYRDGSDAVNYGSDARRRRLARKPLLAGALSAAEAVRFAWLSAVAGTVLWALAALLAPHRPAWAVLGAAVCLLASVQYSWGLRISYHGWQEVFLLGFGAGMVLVPYGLVTGRISAAVVLQALLFGYGPMLFGLYSNTHDAVGDAGVRRRTAAAVLTPRGNAVFVAAVTAVGAVPIAAGPPAGAAPWWSVPALLPALAVRAAALAAFLRRGEVLRARTLGIRAHRLTAAALVAGNLLAPLVTGGGR